MSIKSELLHLLLTITFQIFSVRPGDWKLLKSKKFLIREMEHYGNLHKECVTWENLMSKNSSRGQNGKSPRRAAGGLFQTRMNPSDSAMSLKASPGSHTHSSDFRELTPPTRWKLLPWNPAKANKLSPSGLTARVLKSLHLSFLSVKRGWY